MNVAPDAPKRPALRYYGGKWRLAPWIISHFPAHKNYVEPCGGAASVLLQKPRSPLETDNDLDGNVVNFFRVLRDQPDELIRKIRLTPWARAEFNIAWKKMNHHDPVEWARRFAVFQWMSLVSAISHDSPGCRMQKKGNMMGCSSVQMDYEEIFSAISNRFCGVQIENQPCKKVIAEYDNVDCLIYLDPPYVAETRDINNLGGRTCYAFEWTNDDHADYAELLRNAAGYVVVSGYACPLYTELYEAHGWHRVDKEAQTNSGGKRIESLWLSPRTWKALQDQHDDLPLFATA